ncbi:MAG TPA: haloacid dehalogenase-like hydrolase [Acidobacteriaceae bacterium]|nr:haloacid dehalogenase-like hydrolase [Acidobacteriaceae bacterium]
MTPTLPAHLSAADFHRTVLALAPRTAVFDCDGTLWGGDAGYGFMLWSIKTGLVSRNAADWIDSRYRLYRTGDISELAICGEMVQLYTGLEESELRRAAATFFHSQIHPHIFPEMQRLVADLQSSGCEIWAVSSTNNWVIEEGVRDFGISPDKILSARVAIVNGRITSTLIDVPTDEGKALSLQRVDRAQPDVVFGNSIHDAAMLALARAPFAVNPTPGLLEIAAERNWPAFIPAAIAEGAR